MKKTNTILIIFTLMNFVIQMTALVFNGILDKVATSMNISIANTGLLITMYSYGAAFGVPITLILFRKIERNRMLRIMLLITILSTFALIFSQNFNQLLIIRLIMGISANSYGVLALSTVISFSEKGKQGRAIAFLIMGASLALLIGVPLTRALSEVLDWRNMFGILNIIMILSLIYLKFNLTEKNYESSQLNLKHELNFFKDKRIVQVIMFTAIMFTGHGALYTYITPYLLKLFPSFESSMSIILVSFGIAGFLGNLVGGYLSDKIGYLITMTLGAFFQLVSISLIVIFQPFKWLTLMFFIIWLMSAWLTGLQLNTGIAQITHNKSRFIISMNSSALQFGGAVGSSLATLAISIIGIKSIVFITLFTSLLIVSLQWIFSKKEFSFLEEVNL